MNETYPRAEGDVTVLGPEIFASQDERVINWKGRNYTPQSAFDSLLARVRDELDDETMQLAWQIEAEVGSPWTTVTIHPAGAYVRNDHPEWPLRFAIWDHTDEVYRLSPHGEAEEDPVPDGELLDSFEGTAFPDDHPWRPLAHP